MNLKNFKPHIPVTLEAWGGNRHMFQVGAMDVAAIVAIPEGVLVRLERDVEGMQKDATMLITGPGHGELAEEQEESE